MLKYSKQQHWRNGIKKGSKHDQEARFEPTTPSYRGANEDMAMLIKQVMATEMENLQETVASMLNE